MNGKITLEVVTIPGKQAVVLPSKERIQASIGQMQVRVTELDRMVKDGPEDGRAIAAQRAADLRAEINATLSLEATLREKYTVQELTFDTKGFSNGVAKKSRIAASAFIDGRNHFDRIKYEDLLVSHALDKDMDWIDEQDPSIAEALRREVVDQGEPDPARLAFLSSAPTSSLITGG